MAVKFADEIAKEIQERGNIEVPEGCFTGEAFEEYLHKENLAVSAIQDGAGGRICHLYQ